MAKETLREFECVYCKRKISVRVSGLALASDPCEHLFLISARLTSEKNASGHRVVFYRHAKIGESDGRAIDFTNDLIGDFERFDFRSISDDFGDWHIDGSLAARIAVSNRRGHYENCVGSAFFVSDVEAFVKCANRNKAATKKKTNPARQTKT